ncbi:hypothetical protein [Oceanirhabdus sp. W0125-5]|uniref:hypothetical protein n=1 Tax=Oceanirhabdus sp. W0125-5 TaxID=2999116 RepID=UPI0022F2FE33|nr:hypothetical protein [Oceanirhabdus sp. W0125-5]WBW98479.1 hypothetical protein OW730_06840 [Oceanirhabdus sp. W0125-5]
MNLLMFIFIVLTAIGIMAILLSRMSPLSEKYLKVFYLFAAGNLLTIVALDIIPEAIKEIGIVGMLVFMLIGGIIFKLMHEFIHIVLPDKKHVSAISIGVALASHGLPEGMALGVILSVTAWKGYWNIIIVFLLHIFPEMIMFQQALKENRKNNKFKVIIYSMIIFIPAIMGILISVKFGGKVRPYVGVFSAISSGFIYMLVVKELIFRNIKQLKIKDTLIIILGSVITGMALM